jgi:alkanesulfonate monooxygenase SsuD/methylene tetrahydromethanopterin reductase-like flavin-dependent oxidoreductase (luciferase family)
MPDIEDRLARLNPPPTRQMPILIGGEKVTLRIVAERAHIWNGLADPEQAGRKNRILDDWCRKVGRDPKDIERSINLRPDLVCYADRYVENGSTHLIVGVGGPSYDLSPLR